MKTDTTKLFDEMLKDNITNKDDVSESKKIEQELNERIKASVDKMQETINKRLSDVEANINNIIKEKENNENGKNNEEGKNTGSDESNDLSDEEES